MPDGEGCGADAEGGEVRPEVSGDHLQEHALQQLYLQVDGEEEEVEVPEQVVAGVAAAEAPGPAASSASTMAAEDPPALTGKEAAGAAGKDGGTSGSREAGDGDLGEEREGGGEQPRRRQRRGACARRRRRSGWRTASRKCGEITPDAPLTSPTPCRRRPPRPPKTIPSSWLASSQPSQPYPERERVSKFVEGKGRR
uniref:Uncharacterized protein n=1 Tax=Oryza glumipatula TaxID=40148 RepID=A0A0D9YZ12_9ORYZ